jgi:putative hydrolase of the HAD superfamily
VDPDAVELVGAVRAGGCRVGLLSNATTRLEDDLEHLGLSATFDDVFNTARLGVCKPDPEVYRRVVGALGLPAHEIVFTDDTPSWAEAASRVGLVGIAFTGVTHLRDELQRLGVRC